MKKYKITVDGERFEVEIKKESGSGAARQFTVDVAGREFEILAESEAAARPAARKASFEISGASIPVAQKSTTPTGGGSSSAKGVPVESPMAGKVVAINVKTGDVVTEGHVVAILEAMKMENAITAPVSGKVTEVPSAVGTVMRKGDVLVRIDPEG